MIESKFKQMAERHLKTHKCPHCSALVYLEQEKCPHCGFDLTTWRWNWFRGQTKVFTKETECVDDVPATKTYDAVIKMSREHPQYLPLLGKCLVTHHRKENDRYFETLGFESEDVPCNGKNLTDLFHDYPEVVKRVYNSHHSKGYVVVHVPEVGKAFSDIESGKIATYAENDVFLRVRLGPATVNRLREYTASEMSEWDDNMAVWLVIERAINEFLDRQCAEKLGRDPFRKLRRENDNTSVCSL